jgi:hypothetical protein
MSDKEIERRVFAKFREICRDWWSLQPSEMARIYGVSEESLCTLMLQWARERLIDVITFDGRTWSYMYWWQFQRPESVFVRTPRNNGYVKIFLLDAGARHAESLRSRS